MVPQIQVGTILESPQQVQPRTQNLRLRGDLRAPSKLVVERGLNLCLARWFVLALSDSLALSAAWLLSGLSPQLGTTEANLFLVVNLTLLALRGLYDASAGRTNYLALFQVQLTTIFLYSIFATLNLQAIWHAPEYGYSLVLSTGALVVSRLGVAKFISGLRKRQLARHRVAIFAHPDHMESFQDFVSGFNYYDLVSCYSIEQLGDRTIKDVLSRLNYQRIDQIFVDSTYSDRDLLKGYWFFRNLGITVHRCQYLEHVAANRQALTRLGEKADSVTLQSSVLQGSVFRLQTLKPSPLTGFLFKRVVDFVSAFAFLLVTSPVYALIATLIVLDSPGPVFYRQMRIGLNGRKFKVWKFRTMVVNADELQKQLETQNETKDGVLFKIKDDPRITRIGKILRRYSLDELPQIINVLIGNMSFVGPRPLPIRDVERFSCDTYHLRHEVLPGITGLWQVSGRSNIDDFEQVIDLDVFYIKNWSLLLDFQILLRTFGVVMSKTGAY